MSQPEQRAALAAIESLHGTVTMARVLVEAGRTVDLAGLDSDTATLCTAVALLPAQVARNLRPALEDLVREVDTLRAALPAPSEAR